MTFKKSSQWREKGGRAQAETWGAPASEPRDTRTSSLALWALWLGGAAIPLCRATRVTGPCRHTVTDRLSAGAQVWPGSATIPAFASESSSQGQLCTPSELQQGVGDISIWLSLHHTLPSQWKRVEPVTSLVWLSLLPVGGGARRPSAWLVHWLGTSIHRRSLFGGWKGMCLLVLVRSWRQRFVRGTSWGRWPVRTVAEVTFDGGGHPVLSPTGQDYHGWGHLFLRVDSSPSGFCRDRLTVFHSHLLDMVSGHLCSVLKLLQHLMPSCDLISSAVAILCDHLSHQDPSADLGSYPDATCSSR